MDSIEIPILSHVIIYPLPSKLLCHALAAINLLSSFTVTENSINFSCYNISSLSIVSTTFSLSSQLMYLFYLRATVLCLHYHWSLFFIFPFFFLDHDNTHCWLAIWDCLIELYFSVTVIPATTFLTELCSYIVLQYCKNFRVKKCFV